MLGLILLSVIISGSLQAIGGHDGHSPLAPISWLLSIWVSLALTAAYLAGGHGEKLDGWEALKRGGQVYLPGLLNSVLVGLISVASILLFIIPAFFVIPRLSFALYYVVDKQLGPIEAIKASWENTRGNVGKIYGIFGASLVFAILCLLIIGIYFIFMYQAAMAVLYLYALRNQASPSSSSAAAQTE
jgi:hypothetical protein